MKKNQAAQLLLVLLGVSVLANALLLAGVVRRSQHLRDIQKASNVVSYNQAVARSLVTEVMDYSKRNPAVTPLLHALEQKVNANPGAVAPAATPASRTNPAPGPGPRPATPPANR